MRAVGGFAHPGQGRMSVEIVSGAYPPTLLFLLGKHPPNCIS